MEKLSETKEQNSERRGVIEDEDGVSRKCKKEGEMKKVVILILEFGINETEDNSGVFYNCGNYGIIVKSIN